ncbi:MAG: alpha-hydroxy-acid oxidizing protein, partial [Nonomuraea sp.]|nr:alpha-hydroxy-acid oxidizing protein [Nonomuraea sp.]
MTFSDFQRVIYRDLGAPPYTVNLPALEEAARAVMDPAAFAYLAGAAGTEATARANLAAFARWHLVPRMLRAVAPSLETSLFGTTYPAPVLLAPVAAQTIVHPYGELATARAAAALGVPMVLSSFATHSLEEVAEVAGPRWFQLYWPHDDEITLSLLKRASDAGYTALVVTLDTWLVGWRPRELDLGYNPFMRGVGLATQLADPVFSARSHDSASAAWGSLVQGRDHTWEDLALLRSAWPGPIVLKGILHPDDARRAADAGMDGVIVSNHGGRQVDGAVAALDALP